MTRQPIAAGRKRLPRNAQTKRVLTRVAVDAYMHLVEVCRKTREPMSIALTRILRRDQDSQT